MEKIHLTELHQLHLETSKALDFYVQEINIFKSRLSEISTKNSSKDVLAWVDHFEHQFAIQESVIRDLKDHIRIHEKEFAAQMALNPIAFEHRTVSEDHAFKSSLTIFEKIYAGLKQEFNKFLSKTL